MSKYESSIEWGENYNMLKKSINTSVTINGNYLEVKSEQNERFTPEDRWRRHPRAKCSKPFNPFFLGEKTIDIEDVISVKIENGRIFGFYTIFLILIISIIEICFIYGIFNNSTEWREIFVALPFIMIMQYFLLPLLLDFVEVYKFKALKIKVRNEKSLCIAIEGWRDKNKDRLRDFICETHEINSKIKIINLIITNRVLLISVSLAIMVISFTIGFSSQKINMDICDVQVNVYEAKLIKKYKGSNDYINTYFLENENKKVKIKESKMDSYKKEVNQKYYLWCFKYYSKANNELLKTEYECSIANNENSFILTSKYNKNINIQYLHNCKDNKIYKFFDSQFDYTNKYTSYNLNLYSKSKDYNDDNFDKIYDFIHSDESQRSQEDNDVIKILDTFDSKYGKCYIIKYKYLPRYYLYIENEDIRSKEEYDGIFLYKRNINYFNEIKAKNYFKEVLNY